jgi:DtxR family Mn-dependent transcriptional regulator
VQIFLLEIPSSFVESQREPMATSTVENYLKAILQLDEGPAESINVGAIAEALQVTPGTVTAMMRHLSEERLVDYVPRRQIKLLPKGRKMARQIVRRHRLIETFLVKIMELDWSEVHEEAEVLEHVISEKLLSRIDEMLGHPSHDPHGDPIPDSNGKYPSGKAAQPLASQSPGTFRLARVDDSEEGLLEWLSRHKLELGSLCQLIRHDGIAGIYEVTSDASPTPISMSDKIAAKIWVEDSHAKPR